MSLAVKRFNIVRMILYKSIFDENVIHIILTEYWKDLKNKNKVLVDWIDIEWLSWKYLSENPNAIDLLKKNQDKIDWYMLCINPNAIDLLSSNENKIYWESLSRNPNAIKLLKNRIEFENTLTKEELYDLDLEDKIDWYNLSANPNAIDILENNQYHINWTLLSKNQIYTIVILIVIK